MDVEQVRFGSGSDGEWCAGRLVRPAGEGPHPVVVMGHGLGATMDLGLAPYADRFRDAGFAVMMFDYRGFGSSDQTHPQWLDVKRQLEDWRSAVAHAKRMEGLDAGRVAIWGSSFGGGHVIRTGATEAVAAVIAQCPFTSGPASMRALGARASARVTPLALHDAVAARTRRPAKRVKLVGQPGQAALMTKPDCEPGYRALIPDDVDFDDTVDARIALHLGRHVPGRAARRVTAPLMVNVCDHDSLCPAATTDRLASRAPHAEVLHYPVGHFDIYSGEWFDRVVGDQVEFLTRHLRPDSGAQAATTVEPTAAEPPATEPTAGPHQPRQEA